MTATTAYERKIRRRDVIRLRSKGYTKEEIAEETGYSEKTIQRDIKRIDEQLQKFDDPDFLKRELRKASRTLLEEEYEDLERAEREADERAKHRAKSSMRQTVELLHDLENEFGTTEAKDVESWLDDKDPELRETIANAAEEDVDAILMEEN